MHESRDFHALWCSFHILDFYFVFLYKIFRGLSVPLLDVMYFQRILNALFLLEIIFMKCFSQVLVAIYEFRRKAIEPNWMLGRFLNDLSDLRFCLPFEWELWYQLSEHADMLLSFSPNTPPSFPSFGMRLVLCRAQVPRDLADQDLSLSPAYSVRQTWAGWGGQSGTLVGQGFAVIMSADASCLPRTLVAWWK
ncbi:hypothetical protein Tco_0562119 [Tanacetum coccineum]